ncbi:MAG: hypothetical protein WKF82_01025 [Nocardioidaceae bacterium]
MRQRAGQSTPIADSRPPSLDVVALAVLFATSGLLHFVRPAIFESIVPRQLPVRRQLVLASGAAELACAAGLMTPRTRRLAGLASAALLTAVYPANLRMAVSSCRSGGRARCAVALGRLPLQWPLMRVAWRAWKAQAAQSSRGRLARRTVSRATPSSVRRSTVSASSITTPVS